MILSEENLSELRKLFIHDFHNQFAVNQNHHKNTFIQIIVLLVPLLTGFGYIYLNIKDNNTFDFLFGYLALSYLLLNMPICVLLVMSVGYRRDQLVTARMREKLKILSINSGENYFPGSFLPTNKNGYLNWIPDFNLIFIIVLLSLKIVLLILVLGHPFLNFPSSFCNFNLLLCILAVTLLISFSSNFYFLYLQREKWLKYINYNT
ncbi:hypothetical protein LEP1GSC202_0357 [Leptospira yanagawae serovar Saopaulo str. Sao Paulo = ATCC 700523]|uniref:Uncharacterized protein n=1 Tax=Leptospira yanagawae serovar Saopaulo str. Sao Paulo = ATCC 700523 TaxID=1249483 RepID=A0A5E8HAR8_9LEPT|nr:hypothetical protein [Leptospira yanagawae]EOQ87106.1 hypothetical protein LEP1GSC202_0357 [Leptospira yanagawae serovar Saopaulo str. Sao Paulo = ATCC 700523]